MEEGDQKKSTRLSSGVSKPLYDTFWAPSPANFQWSVKTSAEAELRPVFRTKSIPVTFVMLSLHHVNLAGTVFSKNVTNKVLHDSR